MEKASPSAHVYDSSDPLDGTGDGSGGQGYYMLVGDDHVCGTSDDEYRGLAVFNATKLACATNASKTMCIYHYGTVGSGYNYVDLSLLNMSNPGISAADYARTATIPVFYRIDVSNWTDVNDAWVCVNVTREWNAAVSGGYPYMGMRLDPKWYVNDGNEDAVQISTTGTRAPYVQCGTA